MATRHAPLDQPAGEPGDKGRFASSAQRQIADADDRRRHALLMPRIIVIAVAQADGRAIGNLGQAQQSALGRGERPTAPTADYLAKVGGNLGQNQSAGREAGEAEVVV